MQKNTFPDIPRETKPGSSSSAIEFPEILKKFKRIVIDMGCGHGDFLIENCPKYPDSFFIGIEVSRKRVFKTSARLHKRNITNYTVIDSEGSLALKTLFPESCVDEIYINFPDPWLRKKQWKNRVLKPSFLIQAVRVLKTGANLNFITDVEEYAMYASETLSCFPGIVNNYDNAFLKNIMDDFPTLFYRKMSPLRDINYISFRKTS